VEVSSGAPVVVSFVGVLSVVSFALVVDEGVEPEPPLHPAMSVEEAAATLPRNARRRNLRSDAISLNQLASAGYTTIRHIREKSEPLRFDIKE
jgi:hypothetical protein